VIITLSNPSTEEEEKKSHGEMSELWPGLDLLGNSSLPMLCDTALALPLSGPHCPPLQ
jgi:hypothetical protein